jgi:hypothetical protein
MQQLKRNKIFSIALAPFWPQCLFDLGELITQCPHIETLAKYVCAIARVF